MPDSLTRRSFLGAAAVTAAGANLGQANPQQPFRGTGGRPNLRVIEDFAQMAPVGQQASPAYWFELHAAVELNDAAVAGRVRRALAAGDIPEVVNQIVTLKGGSIIVAPQYAKKFEALLRAMF